MIRDLLNLQFRDFCRNHEKRVSAIAMKTGLPHDCAWACQKKQPKNKKITKKKKNLLKMFILAVEWEPATAAAQLHSPLGWGGDWGTSTKEQVAKMATAPSTTDRLQGLSALCGLAPPPNQWRGARLPGPFSQSAVGGAVGELAAKRPQTGCQAPRVVHDFGFSSACFK